MTVKRAVAYQATDLARKHRQVVDAARNGRALIRDKDGLALVMAPAEELARAQDVSALALDLVRAARVLLGQEPGSAASFGNLGWVSVLPTESQRQFFEEMSEALLVAASGLEMRPIEVLLGDWRATAESWADPDTREQLLAGAGGPLPDVSL